MASELQWKCFSALFKFYSMVVHDYVLKQMFELIIWFILLKFSFSALQKQVSMHTERMETGTFSVSL